MPNEPKPDASALKPSAPLKPPTLAEIATLKKRERDEIHARTRQLENEGHYAEAVVELEKLNEDRRDRVLYDTLVRHRDEVAALQREVEKAAHNGRLTWRHRPHILRWMELQPYRSSDLSDLLSSVPDLLDPPTNPLGMGFALVPPGSFWMGGERGNSGHRHVTFADPLYLGIYPVTQGQWQAVMGNNPSYFSRTGSGKAQVQNVSDSDLAFFPVEQVSWNDAQEFLKRLNHREKNSAWVYRLPREEEWEYACRGRETSIRLDLSQFDCSFDYYFETPTNAFTPLHANFENTLQRTTKVGSYKPNRLGIHDLHGNVWEWCDDVYGTGPNRVIRGGAWHNDAKSCSAANRYGLEPNIRISSLGLRLALLPSE